MIKKAMPLILFAMIFLLIPAYSGAVVIDPAPINITDAWAHCDYQKWGNYGLAKGVGDGQFFVFDISVTTGGYLSSIDNVLNVKAKHIGTKHLYLLQKEEYNWIGTHHHGWVIWLRSENWMYESTWKVILNYLGSNGEKHRQVWETQVKPAFPARISNVDVTRAENSFLVSWSGTGNPYLQPSTTYRVRVFTGIGLDVIEDYRGDWNDHIGTGENGSYDASLNKVTFSIPVRYGGQAYSVRLENLFDGNRSVYYLVLPLPSANE
jgi:hypothetical protein